MKSTFEPSKYFPLKTSDLPNLELVKKGKVREVYKIEDNFLIIASDRISAFDVIMEEIVPNKGVILNLISNYWFDKTQHIINNHLITSNVDEYPNLTIEYSNQLVGRSMLIKKTEPLPIEFVVRGYLAGSGWKEYQKSQTVCGIKLPSGLKEYDKLPKPIFTPAAKNDIGHDENINYEQYSEILGKELADILKEISMEIYNLGFKNLDEKGIILVDTKFEFGKYIDNNGNSEIILIDEVLTPDSSRFWLKEDYKPGVPQMNFDKQVLRDYLETLDWDKQYPAPHLPQDIIEKTLEKYIKAYEMIID